MANNITTTATGISSQPQWFQNYLQSLIGGAAKTASQPYVPYPNARIAGFTPAQQQAFQATESNVGAYKPNFAGAQAAYQTGANPSLNQGVFNSYMNPYTQDVVNQIQTLGNRNLTENVLPGVNSTFTGAGQFGSSRNADFTNRALRDNQEAISQAQGQALAGGFQSQVGNTQNAINQAMQSGQLQQGLGTARQAAGLTDASALSAIGQQQQNQNQANENLGYQDFLTQQQWPYQQESYLSGILGGAPVPTTTQQTQTTPGPSTTSQVLGGLAGVAGLLGSSGAFNSVGSGISNFLGGLFAEGGEFSDGSDGGTPQGGTGVSGWQSDLPGTPFAGGGMAKAPTTGNSAWKDFWTQKLHEAQDGLANAMSREGMSPRAFDEGSTLGTNQGAIDLGMPQNMIPAYQQKDVHAYPQKSASSGDGYLGYAKGGSTEDADARELADRWMMFRQMMGYQQPTPAPSGVNTAPLVNLYAKGGAARIAKLAFGGQPPVTPASSVPKPPVARAMAPRSRRPRFGGIATRRMGGIGMMPGAGTTGILPGAPAGIGGRMPGAMNPGASSIIRGLSGAATPTARVV